MGGCRRGGVQEGKGRRRGRGNDLGKDRRIEVKGEIRMCEEKS